MIKFDYSQSDARALCRRRLPHFWKAQTLRTPSATPFPLAATAIPWDTLAAITGSIAGAAYGIPEWIKEKAYSYLDEPLKDVFRRWEKK